MRHSILKLSHIKYIFAALFITTIQWSCSDDNDNGDTTPQGYEISASLNQTSINYQGGVLTLTITSDNPETWEISIPSNQSWMTADKVNGTGNAEIELTITKNSDTKERFGNIVVKNKYHQKSFYITQARYEEPVIIDNSKWFEIPAQSSIPNTVVVSHMMPENKKIRNYSMLYDKTNRLAYWVAYPLHSYYTTGTGGRTDDWQYDIIIDYTQQPRLFKGFGISGIDRGHQIPSADRTKSNEANATTFYFTNMTAQNSTLNQGIWAKLEGQIRTWMQSSDTLYVVTGAMIQTRTDTKIEYVRDNAGQQVAKPKYYYKALAKKRGNTYYTIAFKMDNSAPSGSSYDSYRMTVSDLEKETGFTFFTSLPESSKNTIVSNQW